METSHKFQFPRATIPRSHSEFNYVSLTPKEKRRTTDFSHLLPQFHKDPPYVRLLDPKVPIVEQPKPIPQALSKMCRSSTGTPVSKSPTLDVIRSHSMRSLRRTLEMSPTKHRLDNAPRNEDSDSAGGSCCDYVKLPEDKDLTRLRNFSVTPKGLVNWGDSFRSRSMPFVPSERPSLSDIRPSSSGSGLEAEMEDSQSACASSSCSREPMKYRIVLLGSSNVGKTTMIKQFRTSEYICAFDSSCNDESDFTLTVVLNGEESELEFVDSCSMEEETDDDVADEAGSHSKLYIPTADAHVVVYSVTSRRSYLHGLRLLSHVQSTFLNNPVFLVGNKSDLVRIRAVTTDEGRTSAKDNNCQFKETSVAINHQVDELLVTILTEIRMTKVKACGNSTVKFNNPHCSISKAKGLIKKFLKKACFQSKSCDNLQRL